MAQKNEFLRGKPASHGRSFIADYINLIISVMIVVAGAFAASQYFASCENVINEKGLLRPKIRFIDNFGNQKRERKFNKEIKVVINLTREK